MAMSLHQNIKIRFALLRKAIKLRRRLTQSEIDAVIAEVLEESKLLFGAVGAVVVVWAEIELHLDFINGVLVLQEPNANIKLPKPLQSRINFFKDALDRVPQLAHLRERASEQGEVQQAREPLAPVYGWFSEGFDTPDLKEGRRCSVSCTHDNSFRNGL
jgi:hypothetical protein